MFYYKTETEIIDSKTKYSGLTEITKEEYESALAEEKEGE